MLTPSTFVLVDFTVTMQLAVLLSSSVVTVMVAVPSFTPLTNPSLFTVATSVLLLAHVTFLFVALEGVTVALSCVSSPSFTSGFPTMLTPLTGIFCSLLVTVTAHVAVWFPSAVTVIVASPGATAVTFPLLSTVATLSLLLSHVTLLFVAVEGDTVALRFVVSPTLRLTELLSSLTPVTLIPFTVPFPLVFSTVPVPATVTLTSV